MNDVYVGCIMYVDDILLLTASVISMQLMLDLCCDYGKRHMILFLTIRSLLFESWL